MKKYSRILIIVNLFLLLGYFNWTIYQKEQILKDGKLVLMRLAPIDPRSLMQGDYMKLDYEEVNLKLPDCVNDQQGFAIIKTDARHVGHIIRLQQSIKPLYPDELAMKYRLSYYNSMYFGSEAFFFEEGQGEVYSNAAYGGFKVDDEGQCLLVGLYNQNFQLLKPDK